MGISLMHFGAAVRSVLSASCGVDLRAARARTVVPALRSPETLRVLAANLEREFGITIPESDLEHLSTVRDVVQCVRLRRWLAAVERRSVARARAAAPQVEPPAPAATSAVGEPRPSLFRMIRRRAPAPAVPPGAPPRPGMRRRPV